MTHFQTRLSLITASLAIATLAFAAPAEAKPAKDYDIDNEEIYQLLAHDNGDILDVNLGYFSLNKENNVNNGIAGVKKHSDNPSFSE